MIPLEDDLEEWIRRVYRFALRLTNDHHAAEDVAQETLLRAWRRRDRLRSPRAACVWLFRIAANVWRDQLRRARHPAGHAAPLPEGADGPPAPEDSSLEAGDAVERALGALRDLPDRQRQVLYLHAFEDLTHAEIATVLGISPGAVNSSLHLAREALRRRLKDVFSPN